MKAIKVEFLSLFKALESAPEAWRDKRTICVWFWAEFYAPIDSLTVRLIKTAKKAIVNTFTVNLVQLQFQSASFGQLNRQKESKIKSMCCSALLWKNEQKYVVPLFCCCVCKVDRIPAHILSGILFIYLWKYIAWNSNKMFPFHLFSLVCFDVFSISDIEDTTKWCFFFEERTKNSPTQTEIQALKMKNEWLDSQQQSKYENNQKRRDTSNCHRITHKRTSLSSFLSSAIVCLQKYLFSVSNVDLLKKGEQKAIITTTFFCCCLR